MFFFPFFWRCHNCLLDCVLSVRMRLSACGTTPTTTRLGVHASAWLINDVETLVIVARCREEQCCCVAKELQLAAGQCAVSGRLGSLLCSARTPSDDEKNPSSPLSPPPGPSSFVGRHGNTSFLWQKKQRAGVAEEQTREPKHWLLLQQSAHDRGTKLSFRCQTWSYERHSYSFVYSVIMFV